MNGNSGRENRRKRFKKLFFKARYLKEEYDECKKVCIDAEEDMCRKAAEIQKTLNVYDEFLSRKPEDNTIRMIDNESPSHSSSAKAHSKNVPKWVKKIFKKIVTKSHPDKISHTTLDDDRDLLVSSYRRAVESYNGNLYYDLIEIYEDLRINRVSVSDEEMLCVEEEIKDVEKKISDLKHTIFWVWHNSSDSDRDKILAQFIKVRGWTSTSASSKQKSTGIHPGKSLSWIRKKYKI